LVVCISTRGHTRIILRYTDNLTIILFPKYFTHLSASLFLKIVSLFTNLSKLQTTISQEVDRFGLWIKVGGASEYKFRIE